MNGRTRRARRNQSIDTLHAPALGCSHCNYSWQTTTPEGSCDAASKSARAQRFHEGTPCCEPPNNSSPAHPRKRGREPEPGVLTRESYRLAVHIVKRHNRFTHCPDTRLLTKKSQRRACCWARRTAESNPFRRKKTRLDARRRMTNRSEAHRGLRKRARSSQPRPHSSSQRHFEHLPQTENVNHTRREQAQSLPAIAPQRARPRARRVRPAGTHKTATT